MAHLDRGVYFVVANEWTGTAHGRGTMVSDYLQKHGYTSDCFVREVPTNLVDSIFIFIKFYDRDLAERLKSQNNIVLLDVLDGYNKNNFRPPGVANSPIITSPTAPFIEDYFNGYIFSVRQLLSDVKHLLPSDTINEVIYEKFDPQVLKYKNAMEKSEIPYKFRLGFIGAPENILHWGNSQIRESLTAVYDFAEQPKYAPYFTCHYSVRIENSADFLYKPTSKLCTAAGAGANIIHTRDSSIVEIIGPDYPYYTTSDAKAVLSTIEFARESFEGAPWREGLEMMAIAKERLNIDRICGVDYIKYLGQFC